MDRSTVTSHMAIQAHVAVLVVLRSLRKTINDPFINTDRTEGCRVRSCER